METKVPKGALPTGYSFVPKGNVYITSNCRKLTQAHGSTVYIVVDAKNQQIGLGVPMKIYVDVQFKERSTRAERAANVVKRDEGMANGFQKEILKIFPKIPPDALRKVAKIAMEKGKGKVGRVGKLDVQRKARLAVWAHVRHCETDYDKLLRNGVAREDARQQVESKIKEVYKAWGSGPHTPWNGNTRKTSQVLAGSNVKFTNATKGTNEDSAGQPKKNAKFPSLMTVTTNVASPNAYKTARQLAAVRIAKRVQRQKESEKVLVKIGTKPATQPETTPKTSSPKVIATAASFREKRTAKPRLIEPIAPTPPMVKPRWVVPEMPKLEHENRAQILRLIARVDRIERAHRLGRRKQRQRHATRLSTIASLNNQINEILTDASFQKIETSAAARKDLARRLRRMVRAPEEGSG